MCISLPITLIDLTCDFDLRDKVIQNGEINMRQINKYFQNLGYVYGTQVI